MPHTLRWLHLSDFHIGQDAYGQGKIAQYIQQQVKQHGQTLDLILITGDIGFSGQEDDYRRFQQQFVEPMTQLVGPSTAWLMVPGNHDVDREAVERLDRSGFLRDKNRVFEPTARGLKQRQWLLPGLQHYREYIHSPAQDWLASEQGVFHWTTQRYGMKLGVVGINTAWLAKDDEDKGALTPGKALVEEGLLQIQDCTVKIVLGHHPIEDWVKSDQQAIKALFRHYNVLYLHGHCHETWVDQEPRFLALQAGAAFQGREHDQWKNRLLWGELTQHQILLSPYVWSQQHQTWTLDSDAFNPEHKVKGQDQWAFNLPVSITPVLATKPEKSELDPEKPDREKSHPTETKNPPKLPIGNSDFQRIIRERYFYVDKSRLIQEVYDQDNQVLLIPRPRRFGKTLNMNMLNTFFAHSEESHRSLFDGLEIGRMPEYMQHQGQYPVIFLTFKDIKQTDWQGCLVKLKHVVAIEFERHIAVKPTLSAREWADYERIIDKKAAKEDIEFSLKTLTSYLHRHYHKRAIILIDEYDMPILAAYQNGYYEEAIAFFRNFLSSGLKDNEAALEKGVLTGILRIAKESIFSGLNNLGVFSVLKPEFADKFGLTEAEVKTALANFGLSDHQQAVDAWFNGYRFGQQRIYNPWSIIQFLSTRELKPYWVNTSRNELIRDLITQGDVSVQADMATLLNRGEISATLDEAIVYSEIKSQRNAIWSFLTLTGYLSAERTEDGHVYQLKIPNKELLDFFRQIPKTPSFAHLTQTQIQHIIKNVRIGIIPALPEEAAAVMATVDPANRFRYTVDREGAAKEYNVVRMPSERNQQWHYVAITQSGKGSAGPMIHAAKMQMDFPALKSLIVSGIAAGVSRPDKPEDDVRVGDIVVSGDGKGIVKFQTSAEGLTPGREIFPSAMLSDCVNLIKTDEWLPGGDPLPTIIEETLTRLDKTLWQRPPANTDPHNQHTDSLIRASKKNQQPVVHMGRIANVPHVLKAAEQRQKLGEDHGVMAIDMEDWGSGMAALSDNIHFLSVRGISDNADENKKTVSARWRYYAALVAAAYVRQLIGSLAGTEL